MRIGVDMGSASLKAAYMMRILYALHKGARRWNISGVRILFKLTQLPILRNIYENLHRQKGPSRS